MDKINFISQIKPVLKQQNYRKDRNYWYKTVDNHICCINVEGSQWDKDNYYVEIGFSLLSTGYKNPRLLQWYCRHRCVGEFGDRNILPSELLASMDSVFGKVLLTSEIDEFLKDRHASKVVSQFWF